MPEGSTLLDRLDHLPEASALRSLRRGVVTGVPGGAVALLAWWWATRCARRVLLVSTEPETLWEDGCVWAGGEGPALFPASDTLPFDRVAPGEEVTRRRLGTLVALARENGGGPSLVVASPQALVRPTLAPQLVRDGVTRIRRGAAVRRDDLVRRLVSLGYRREPAVTRPGEFAVRGGIVDVFPPDRTRPWRAEWFGDEVEDLRAFDSDTQVSVGTLPAAAVVPARELDLSPEAVSRALAAVDALDLERCRPDIRDVWLRDRERLALGAYSEGVDLFAPYLAGDPAPTLFDHLGDALVLLAGGAGRIWRAVERHLVEAEGLRAQEEERGELPDGARSGLVTVEVLRARLEAMDVVEVGREAADGGPGATVDVAWHAVEPHVGRFDAWSRAVSGRIRAGATVLVLSRQNGRVAELSRDQGLDPVEVEDVDSAVPLADGALVVAPADLSAGFTVPGAALEVVSDAELFGRARRRGSPLSRGARRAESTSARGTREAATERAARRAFVIDFAPGELVVHRDHGIARFVDMRRVADGDGESEYMTLEYADGDKLHVPVAHLDRVERYAGGADARPHLSKLGTGEWERTKRRVKERTEEVARELLAIYAAREASEGHAYPTDGAWQHALESSFPYQETPDQELVLEEIKRDMESGRPMDRVVCGDVGFGKTEVALRAAFKAATDGRQVAVLVPTTVLAQQHHHTFTERLAPFPITVRQLSRFCSEEDVRATLAGLESGGVDIVIGTHRLLQRDVRFRNLGLVVIDEEQRFGVLQKERFKQLRAAVDVLSLSATPIPRTLHMSLAGIRDMSVIATPPEERQPIKTYVTAYEEGLIREVITRELARGGQVFYVHNRVQTIQREADSVRGLLPGVRAEVAHGQMPEGDLARVMEQFTEGDVDVLVCTTIIESGLDIPNANTIVVSDAHRLGLAQLYQLRGRVGRAGQRAYAYFLYPPARSLTERADKRLEVIADLQDLGAGFTLALRDLEIRGAGNLLGEEQHGEIAAVGLELYNHLLRQSVAALQGKVVRESPAQVTVALPNAALLPSDYVPDEALRLRCYQDLAACTGETELDRQVRGLADRFGPLPVQAADLVLSLRVRLLAAACGATAVEREPDAVVVKLPLGHGLDLEAVARQFPSKVAAGPTRLRVFTRAPGGRGHAADASRGVAVAGWDQTLLRALRELGRLARLRNREAVPA